MHFFMAHTLCFGKRTGGGFSKMKHYIGAGRAPPEEAFKGCLPHQAIVLHVRQRRTMEKKIQPVHVPAELLDMIGINQLFAHT